MMTLSDNTEAGSLLGAVDGANRTYTTSLPMRLDRVVDVYLNGELFPPQVANGYQLADPRTLVMNEPPVVGDVLAVRYSANPIIVGVAGSQPQGLEALALSPARPAAALVGDGQDTLKCVVRPC